MTTERLAAAMGVVLHRRASLWWLRVLMGISAAIVAHTVAGSGADAVLPVAAVTGGWLAATTFMEASRLRWSAHDVAVLRVQLGLDGIWIAVVRELTGGPGGPLALLVAVHLVAVTLLTSHRVGLTLALWHSLLYLFAYAAELAGLTTSATVQLEPTQQSVLAVASFLGLALVTAVGSYLNERDLRRGKRAIEAVAELSHVLSVTTDPLEQAHELARHARGATGFERVAVLTATGDERRVVVSSAGRDDEIEAGAALDEIARGAWDQRRTVLVAELDAVTDPVLSDALGRPRNVVVVPMVADDEPVGVLAAAGPPSGGMVEARTVMLLEQMASHTALALRNTWLLAEVARLADHDALTGLANRRVLDRTLTAEVARTDRGGGQLALVLFDVDHFKRVNDEHGHQVGDAVLAALGRVLAHCSRGVDVAARYGGEELALVLPGATADDAVRVAERVRAETRVLDAPVQPTISAGVAVVPRHGVTVSELITAADSALYEAKRSGRDRVVVAGRRLTALPG